MSRRDAETISAIATIGGTIIALHGITSKNWSYAHTLFLALAVVGAVATLDAA
jgi:hypothetical protein